MGLEVVIVVAVEFSLCDNIMDLPGLSGIKSGKREGVEVGGSRIGRHKRISMLGREYR